MISKYTLLPGLMITAITFVYPQSGTLVPSFGTQGISQIDFGQPGENDDKAEVVKTDDNGKIWIAGSSSNGDNYDFSVVRLNSDGKRDSTFGEEGKLLFTVGNGEDRAYGLYPGIDGKIRIIGRSDDNFSVVQLKYDGTPDSSFSDDGRLIIPANSSQDDFKGLGSMIDKAGRILIAGGTYVNNSRNILVVRLNPDGNADNSFGIGGKVFIPLEYGIPVINVGSYVCSLGVDTSGNILIAGNSYGSQGLPEIVINKIDSLGNTDVNFGVHGRVVIFGNDGGYANNMRVDEHGKILIAGVYVPGGVTNFWKYTVIRLEENGSFDDTFDVDGIAFYTIGGNGDMAAGIATDTMDKIIVAGTSTDEKNKQLFSVMRLKPEGSPDSTFNDNGKQLISMDQFDEARSLSLEENGRILVAGFTSNGTNTEFAITRVNADGGVDSTFNATGKQIIMLGKGNDQGKTMATDPTGKIWIAGSSFSENGNKFSIARLNSDGSADTTFNRNGRRILPSGNPEYFSGFDYRSIAVDTNGKVLLSGSAYNGTNDDFGVMRLDKNGIPDTAFGENGMKLIPMGEFDEFVTGINLLPNDRILMYGFSYNSSVHREDSVSGCIIRLLSDGNMDSTFNLNGKRFIPDIKLYKLIASYPDGSLLIAGSNANHGGLSLVKISADGRYDSTYFVTNTYQFIDITADSRNRIVMLNGYGEKGYHNVVQRFNPDRSIDSTFGVNGMIEFLPGDGNFSTIASDLFKSGNIYLTFFKDKSMGVLKLKDNGSPDTTFGHNGQMMVTNGRSNDIEVDSNYLWLAGSGDGDYKMVKLFARNNQQIDFTLPDTIQYGNSPVKLTGTASSGLPVSYATGNPAVAFISHDTLGIAGFGSVTITARQGGDGSYYAADPVIRNLVVKSDITGVQSRYTDNEINAFPNPVSGILFIQSQGKIKSVDLTGAEGTILYKRTDINGHSFTLDISRYKPGFYLLTVGLDDQHPVHVLKILKY